MTYEFKMHSVGCGTPRSVELPKLKVRGWFGRDHEGKYTEDAEQCVEFLHVPLSPNVNFDLNYQHPNDEERDNGDHIDYIFRWIMRNYKDKDGKPVKPIERFISYQSHFKTFMESAYQRDKGWDVYCSCIKGNIYLMLDEIEHGIIVDKMDSTDSDLPTPGMKLREAQMRSLERSGGLHSDLFTVIRLNNNLNVESMPCVIPEQEKTSRYGRKFEHHLLSSSRTEAPDPHRPMSRYSDMSIVLSAELAGNTMLYSGEADGVPLKADLDDLDKSQLIEIKTVNENITQRSFQRYKMLKFWLHNVMGRCDILLGYRNDTTGFVHRLERLRGPDITAQIGGLWEPEVCINFLLDILDIIERTVCEAPEETIYQFQWRPHDRNVIRSARLAPSKDGVSWVIPNFYRKWLNTFNETEKPPEKVLNKTILLSNKDSVNNLMPFWAK